MSDRTELERLLAEWHEHGDPAAAEQFIAAHPEHSDALRKHLGVLDLVEHAFSPRPVVPESLGPFRIEKELGSGGMGCVYRAVVAEPVRGIATGRTVALKVVHAHLFRTQGFFKRFLREAELGQRIDHPNVVRTLDADAVEIDDRPQHYLVMEYVEGQTLRDLVEDVDRVPEELTRHIGCEVAKALSAIHAAGAVHRDLKPENILITEDHEIKVMDLGVARLADEQVRLSQTGAFVGSLHYAAPEQFGGGADVDHRSDLHGLGLLLYEIATGTNPFADEDARIVMRRILSDAPRKAGELNPQLSPFFEELLAQLLAKDPAERFGSATELLAILEQSEQSAWWQSRAKELRTTTHRPLRRIRIPRETAVYGRDAELAQLRAFYDKANAGDGQVLLIEGEAGIGKTRLVDEFVSRLQQDGEDVNFLFASYPPGGAATAAGAFAAAYLEQLGEQELEGTLKELLPRTPTLVPGFAALLRGDVVPRGSHPLTKDALQTCFAQLTRSLSTERTTVVLIDDLHFAPEEGRALFTSVAVAVPGHRAFLVGTMRPGVPEEWTAGVTRLDQASHLTVPRLGPKDLVQLLGDTFKSQRLAEELSGKIAVKSDGNPFFAFEIVRGLREGQFIRQKADGSWETTRLIEDIEVPSSVLDLVNARVAELDEDERNLLDVAACWGYEFDPTLVAAAVGLARVPALRRLAQIEKKHRLVRSIGRRTVFDHHQVQEALYAALPEVLREEYHAALAEALESRVVAEDPDPANVGGVHTADICDHSLRGSRPRRALPHLDASLHHLWQTYAFERLLATAERALAIPELLDGTTRLKTILLAGAVAHRIGRLDLLERYCLDAQNCAREINDPRGLAIATSNLGLVYLGSDRLDEAEPCFAAHRDYAVETEDRRAHAIALGHLASVHGRRGQHEEEAALLEGAIALAAEISDEGLRSQKVGQLGSSLVEQGRYDEAYAIFNRGLAAAAAAENQAGIASNAGHVAGIDAAQGRYADALRLRERTRGIFAQMGERGHELVEIGQIGCALRDVGRFDEAGALLQQALDGFAAMGVPHKEDGYRAEFALLREAEGRLDESLRHLEVAVQSERDAGVLGHVAEFLVPLSRVEREIGMIELAAAHVDEAIALGEQIGMPQVVCLAHAEKALWNDGDPDEAAEMLQRFEPRVPLVIRIRVHHTLWRASGNSRHLRAARQILDQLVIGAAESAHDSMLEVVPLYRDVLAAWHAEFGDTRDCAERETRAG